MRISLILCVFLFCNSLKIKAQDFIELPEKAEEFIYGNDSLLNFIKTHLEIPAKYEGVNLKQTIMLSFTIDTSGNVIDINILGKNKDSILVNEGIRVLMLTSSNWLPASNGIHKIKMRHRLPITFNNQLETMHELLSDSIYISLEVTQPATYKGGWDSLQAFIIRNMEYPNSAGLTCGYWIVTTEIIVDNNGALSNIKILDFTDGIPEGVSSSIINAIKLTSGKWSCAYKNNKPVNMKVRVPVTFRNTSLH